MSNAKQAPKAKADQAAPQAQDPAQGTDATATRVKPVEVPEAAAPAIAAAQDTHHGVGGLYTVTASGQRQTIHRTLSKETTQ